MANNSIGAYAQGGQNDIGAFEKAAAAGGGTDYPQGLSTIEQGSNPQRSQSLGGELQFRFIEYLRMKKCAFHPV